MLVKFTRDVPGGEARGYTKDREHDWPMQLVTKVRADYGDDVLEFVGNGAARTQRMAERQQRHNGGPKPSRQERLMAAGILDGGMAKAGSKVDAATAPKGVEVAPPPAPDKMPGHVGNQGTAEKSSSGKGK